MFLPDPACRAHMIMPVITTIDYRAACFCHHKMVDIGHVCSVCLSSKCVVLHGIVKGLKEDKPGRHFTVYFSDHQVMQLH